MRTVPLPIETDGPAPSSAWMCSAKIIRSARYPVVLMFAMFCATVDMSRRSPDCRASVVYPMLSMPQPRAIIGRSVTVKKSTSVSVMKLIVAQKIATIAASLGTKVSVIS